MVSLLASVFILCTPFLLFGLISYWCWYQGWLGRVGLALVVGILAVNVHSMVHPEYLLKDRYLMLTGMCDINNVIRKF